jgi:TRAP-type uncharacterized transport system fused permease subunit
MDLSFALFGRFRGGAAKVAVVSSSLFGSLSGSAVANVVATGSLTIPIMKKSGYPSYFAGAVEAVASTGGQIVPPMMGAAAFLIVEFLGIPYTQVMAAAILPAFLYYLGVFLMVDMQAAKQNLHGIPKDDLPNAAWVIKKGGIFFAPMIILVYLLAVHNTSPMPAGGHWPSSRLLPGGADQVAGRRAADHRRRHETAFGNGRFGNLGRRDASAGASGSGDKGRDVFK